ncbi:nitroreductase [Sporosarcina sp. BI001-red]|uniref:nitroreductase family protein n=1 Tax=Sporosarcina sp. BI001-red TaxID=2282866 RepID=UPI000E2776A9|nr:nitroreductase family protein [Sporosarcina sp. BI001-red]REB05342.1 nitroreductase [Sporosarcina sp. BI001-red]
MLSNTFLKSVENRRSIYAINNEPILSDEKLEELIQHAVKHTPSAFNSQTARVVVLFGEQSKRLWEITSDTLKKIVPEENFESTAQRMTMFGSGYGTILFFEDMQVVESLQEQFEEYKDNFPTWSQQSSGMVQHVIWTALSDEGYGASLQHYNPLIDDAVKAEWNLPSSWKLMSQMPFGKVVAPAGEKEFLPIGERLHIFK